MRAYNTEGKYSYTYPRGMRVPPDVTELCTSLNYDLDAVVFRLAELENINKSSPYLHSSSLSGWPWTTASHCIQIILNTSYLENYLHCSNK